MAETKSKVTPAAQAEGEAQQNTAAQDEQQQATDTAPPDGLQPAGQGVVGDNQEQQETAQQDSQATVNAEAQVDAVEANAIEVVAKCESFRRAGREFTREAVTILLEDLTEAEFKLLYDEPMLAVQFTHVAEED